MARSTAGIAAALTLFTAAIAPTAVDAQENSAFVGPYLGVTAGYAQQREDFDIGDAEWSYFTESDFTYGMVAGWRGAVNTKLVLGVEFFADLTDAIEFQTYDPNIWGITTYSVDYERTIGVGATAGYMINSLTMIYGGVYYTNARIRERIDAFGLGSNKMNGIRMAGGVELQVMPRMSVRGSAYFTDFDNTKYIYLHPTLGALPAATKPSRLGVTVAAIYNF